MKVARGVLMKKFWTIALLALISTSIIFLFPPSNLVVILIFSACVSLIFGLISRFFTERKYAFFLTLAIFIALTLRALDLFDPVNLALAISLLVGVSILIK